MLELPGVADLWKDSAISTRCPLRAPQVTRGPLVAPSEHSQLDDSHLLVIFQNVAKRRAKGGLIDCGDDRRSHMIMDLTEMLFM